MATDKQMTELKEENIQLLCARHNLEKSASLEK